MILEVQIPSGSAWITLKPLIPVFLSYLMSYLFIAIYWGNHHHLIHSIKKVTSPIIWANFNLLFWLSLIPIATGWMGKTNFAPNTVFIYGILLMVCGIAFTILQAQVQKTTVESSELTVAFYRLKYKGILSVIVYLIAIIFAYINTMVSGLLFFAVAILWIVPDKLIEHALNNMEKK